jgi:Kef-type K+ transport system membrane component KefB
MGLTSLSDQSFVFSLFLIFTGAAVLASVALYTKQPLLVAYIVLGALLGPYGYSLISDTSLLKDTSHVGIIFLLFLLGLDMQPSHLIAMLKKASSVAIGSSIAFFSIGFSISWAFGLTHLESTVIGLSLMFSSTIIGIKLLPTTVLHHRPVGELVVGLLLLQDIIAIIVLIVIYANQAPTESGSFAQDSLAMLKPLIAMPLLTFASFKLIKYIILPLIERFDKFHEYIFLLAIGWCLGMAETAQLIGLSAEMGAFIAGVSLASSPISQYIATHLKPLRDFFLILFFFSIGASFNLGLVSDIALPSIILALAVVTLKPVIFRFFLLRIKEQSAMSWEVGFRLGQTSEFSLLIAYVAASSSMIGVNASHIIQATAILTFLLSSYIVLLNFPSPIAIKDSLRRD